MRYIMFAMIITVVSCASSVDSRKEELTGDQFVENLVGSGVINAALTPVASAVPIARFRMDSGITVRQALVDLSLNPNELREIERSGWFHSRWIRWSLSPSYDIVAVIPKQERGRMNLDGLGLDDTCSAIMVFQSRRRQVGQSK